MIDSNKLKISWTKYDVVQLIEIVANGDLNKTDLKEINGPIVKKVLCTGDKDELPQEWLAIEKEYDTERGQVALLMAIISSSEVTELIINDAAMSSGIGTLLFDGNNKVNSNLRSALVVSGSTEAVNRRASKVSFDFVALLSREKIGLKVKELLRLKVASLTEIDKTDIEAIDKEIDTLQIYKVLGVKKTAFDEWLNGKHINLKARTKSKPKTKESGTAFIANRFICEEPKTINLIDAVKNVLDGKWALAPFQRPEAWEWPQQELLLDSLKQGIPIGVMYLWGYDKKNNIPYRNVPGVSTDKDKIEALIIDGQQRLSFLTWLALKAQKKEYAGGPSTIYFNALENVFTKTESHEDLGMGIIRVHNLFASGYKDQLDRALKNSLKSNKLTVEEYTYIGENIDGLHNAIFDRHIVIQTLSEKEGIPESFKLYERVNKNGKELAGNDYVEGALFSVYPNLYEDVKSAVNELVKDPEGKKNPTFTNIFSRGLFIRAILDDLYGIPNPEERKTKPLSYLMRFGDPKYPKGDKLMDLTEAAIKSSFNRVYDAYKHYKEILVEDLFIYDHSGINGTFSIPANAVLRNLGRKMSQQKKGKFIRWFILFHIQHNPYLGSQDRKIKEDCEAARLEDPFDKLDVLLASHSNKSVSDLKFTTGIYGSVGEKAKKQVSFLYHVNLAIAIHKGAKDWFEDKRIEKIPRSDLHKHHIFPSALFDAKHKKWADHIGNIARIKKTTNSSINSNEPSFQRYLPDILKRDPKLLTDQQIPIDNQRLWSLMPTKKHKEFVNKRIDIFVKDSNEFLKKLALGNWEAVIPSDTKSDNDLLKDIESQKLEFKETLLYDTKRDSFEPDMIYLIVKEIAGFMNNGGGTLFIGVKDKVSPDRVVGLDRDLKIISENYPKYADPKEGFQTLLDNRLKSDLKRANYDKILSKDFVRIDGKLLYKIEVPHIGDVIINKYKKWEPDTDAGFKTWKDVLFVRRNDQTEPDSYINEKGDKVELK